MYLGTRSISKNPLQWRPKFNFECRHVSFCGESVCCFVPQSTGCCRGPISPPLSEKSAQIHACLFLCCIAIAWKTGITIHGLKKTANFEVLSGMLYSPHTI
jgi:hypothetical protein